MMARPEKTGEKRRISPLWPMAGSFLVMIYVVYVLLFMSRGWFSRNYDGNGKGTGLYIGEVASLYVYNADTAGNTDEIDWIRENNPDDEHKDDLNLSFSPEGQTMLRPGASGQFAAYVRTNRTSLNVTLRVEYGSHTDLSSSDDLGDAGNGAMTTALGYANAHMAFFASKTNINGSICYSDWIPSGERYIWNIGEHDLDAPQTLRVYWLWIESYEDIASDTGVICEADRNRMMAALNSEPGRSLWFRGLAADDESMTESARLTAHISAYNSADMNLADALDWVSFALTINAT